MLPGECGMQHDSYVECGIIMLSELLLSEGDSGAAWEIVFHFNLWLTKITKYTVSGTTKY